MIGTVDAARLQTLSVNSVLDRIRKAVFRGRVRLHEFFADFDPLRSGLVTEAKFRTALDASGLQLEEPELTLLASFYAEDASADQLRCKYKEFLADVNTVFTKPGMETDPMTQLDDFTQTVCDHMCSPTEASPGGISHGTHQAMGGHPSAT